MSKSEDDKVNKILIFVLRFLKENDLYSKYIKNIKEHPNGYGMTRTMKTNLIAAIEHRPTKPLFSTCIGFNWDNSNEGYYYWDRISIRLTKFLQENEQNIYS